jgi:hypothetical protein
MEEPQGTNYSPAYQDINNPWKRNSWSYLNLIGQDREWTPTRIPRVVSANTTVNRLDDLIMVDCTSGDITITLETSAGGDGRPHTIMKSDSSANSVIVEGSGSETINGALNYEIPPRQFAGVHLKAQGGNWVLNGVAAANWAPASPNTSVQWNDNGFFGGSANLVFVSPTTTAHTLTVSTGNLTVTPGIITTGSTTSMSLRTTGGEILRLVNTATCVNRIQMTGAIAGDDVEILSEGSDSAVPLNFSAKGTGNQGYLSFSINGSAVSRQMVVGRNGPTSTDRFVTVLGGASSGGTSPKITSGGLTGASVSHLDFECKGATGFTFLKEGTTTAAVVISVPATLAQGITLGANDTTNPPSVACHSTQSDCGLDLVSKGVGDLRFGPVGTAVYAFQVNGASDAGTINATILMTPGGSSNFPRIEPTGSATNIGIRIFAKGAEAVYVDSDLTVSGDLVVTGGTLDGVTIGGSSAAPATVTTLSASSTVTLTGTAANISTGSNYISNGGTDAGLNFDSSNNAIFSAAVRAGAPVRLKNYTVATLPAGTQGDVAYVTDALAPAFLTALVGGGAVVAPAFYDGTNWVAI